MLASGYNWTDVLQAGGTVVSAVTSVALVIVAVRFRDEVRLARRRPELTLLHDPEVDALEFNNPPWNYDLHLRVLNKQGQDRAVRVGLELVGVRPRIGTPPLALRPPLRPFAVAELNNYEATEVDVPPNLARRFLVAFFDSQTAAEGVELALLPRAQDTLRDVLPPGEYDLTLALTAANSDATFWRTTLIFLGVSGPDDYNRSRLKLSSPICVPPGSW